MLEDLDAKHQSIVLLTLAIGVGYFLEYIDSYALSTVLLPISKDLHTSLFLVKSAMTAYLICFGIFIPVSGWMADRYGLKVSYSVAIVIFLLGSVLSSVAYSAAFLIVARMFQGIGAAFMTPLGRLIMLRIYGADRIVTAIARITVVTALGMAIGPILGGALATGLSWRWIFYINIPFGVAGLVLIKRCLPKDVPVCSNVSFDYLGFFILAVFLSCLLLFLEYLPEADVMLHMKMLLLLCVVFFAVFYIMRQVKARFPLYPKEFFTEKTVLSLCGSLIVRLGYTSVVVLIPLFFQVTRQYSAFHASFFVLPIAATIFLGKKIVALLMKKYELPRLLLLVLFVMSLSLLSLGVVFLHYNVYWCVISITVFGVLNSIMPTLMNYLVYKSVGTKYYNQIVSCNSSVIQLGAAFSIAIAFLCLHVNAHSLMQLGQHSVSGSHIIALSSFFHTYLLLAIMPIVSMVLFMRLFALANNESVD